MEANDPNFRRVPFPATSDSQQFIEQMNAALRSLVEEHVGEMVPKENTETFYHGRTFVYQQEDSSTREGGFEKRAAEGELKLESIISGDLQALLNFIGPARRRTARATRRTPGGTGRSLTLT